MSRKSECHHIKPAKIAAVITWKTLRVLKDSCFRSLRLLWRRILNWLNHEEKEIVLLQFLCSLIEEWLPITLIVPFVGILVTVVVSMQAAFTFGANKVLYEETRVCLIFGLSLSLALSSWQTPAQILKSCLISIYAL